MAIDINLKIREYKQSHPELSAMRDVEIANIMVREGVISQKDIENLPQLLASSQNLDNTDVFVSTFKNNLSEPSEISANTHPLSDLILVDKNGNIDISQFELENLQKRFPADKFTVDKTNYGIFIDDKETRRSHLIISNFKRDDGGITLSLSQPMNSAVPNSKGKNVTIAVPANGSPYIVAATDRDSNGATTKMYNENSQLLFVKEEDAIGRIKNYTSYDTNPPQKMIENGNMLFVTELKNTLRNQNIDFNAEYENINKYMELSFDSGAEFLKQYKEKNHSDYYDDLSLYCDLETANNFFTRFAVERNRIKNNMNSLLATDDNSSQKQAKLEYYRNYINDYDNYISDFIKKKVSGDNFPDTLSILAVNGANMDDLLRKNPNMLNDIANSNMPIEYKKIAQQAVIKPFTYLDRSEDITNIIMNSNLEPLLYENNDLLSKLRSADTQEEKNALFIDILRYSDKNLRQGSLSFTTLTTPQNSIRSNGKIDLPFKQGKIGDCWLLAGIMSIKDKPGGQEFLDSLLDYNETDKSVTVNLKGVDKKYKISQEEIDNSVELVSQDGDVRAVEIAVDRYIAELAKKGESKSVNINANQMEFVLNTLLGNGKIDIDGDQWFVKNHQAPTDTQYDEIISDFNNPNKAYSFSFFEPNPVVNNPNEFYNKNIEEVDGDSRPSLFINHAYSIVKSDDEFIYFRNPHDSSKMYKMDIEFFKKFKPSVQSADLNV